MGAPDRDGGAPFGGKNTAISRNRSSENTGHEGLSLQAPPPHFESNARKCDTHATRRINRAHGAYVRSTILKVANTIYVQTTIRNEKRLAVVEPD
jgi:hypothetical protein